MTTLARPPVPRAKARAEQIAIKRLLFRQLATCGGAWTDGVEVFTGAALAAKKRDAVHALIRLRTTKRDRLPWGKRLHNLNNLAFLERSSRYPGRPDRDLEPDRLVAIALRSRRDPVGEAAGSVRFASCATVSPSTPSTSGGAWRPSRQPRSWPGT